MGSQRRPTMADVAELAGVSLKTVSRVVNGVATVDDEMAARVIRAVEELGYRHNLLAASLKSGRGRGSSGSSPPTSPTRSSGRSHGPSTRRPGSVATGADDRLRGEPCDRAGDRPRPVRAADPRPDRHPGGRLVCLPHRRDRPWVAGGVCRPPRGGVDADTVLVDNRGLGRRMAKLAVERGHRRIGILLGSESIYTHRERFAGIMEALGAVGIEIDPELIVRDVSEPSERRVGPSGCCPWTTPRRRSCAPTTG
ncbi:LacI family transcriptional regulator [Tessaracoccus sp. HDW20]|uniref:LacI family DNA-binding transcriptional regulator n=1 Tax=Tessaracoccus coleopterorum TaxID=2714950 RepID=UPI0018D355AA|nr:LacI family DNA-binding transcriptional regulator [Tessaracoccus coleopterorum]NHB84539.1 LacI family transcriptional regulator [Tessaracoccus coleopterorum]